MYTILIIEDEPRVASLLMNGLEENGYQTMVAYDGLMGLRLFQAHTFDLVISDIVLPKMDGFELTKEIRKSNPRIPILMLTALGSTNDKLDGFDAGADDYMVKPIDFSELLMRVRALLRRANIEASRKLNEAGIKCTTLTKGLLPIELAELSAENEHGITLITLDEAYREHMEPGAVSCSDRLAALKALHDAGCKTWVSMEPYPTPNMVEQDLHELLEAVSFTDRIIFGRMNYSKVANSFEGHMHFYNERAAEVIAFCQEHGIDYHIKKKTITEE